MRVEADSASSSQPAPIPQWHQPVPEDQIRGPENAWPPQSQQMPELQPDPHDELQLPQQPPFPLHVDPALNPHQHPHPHPQTDDQGQEFGPFSDPPTYPATRSQRTRSHGSNASSRARTDLLSPNAAALFRAATAQATDPDSTQDPGSPSSPTSASGVPRLPPILQVEKQTVTTTATQAASASRRRNEAMYQCPVPGCGSTFTRRFNLRGHLRSHTEERPYVCDWPGCNKGFARQHDCKRHYALHIPRQQASHTCRGCNKSFSRTDALNRHLRSENGAECRNVVERFNSGVQAQLFPGHPMMHMDANGLMPGIDALVPPPNALVNGNGEPTPAGSVSPAGPHSPALQA